MGLGLRGVRGSGAAEAVGVTEAPLEGGPERDTHTHTHTQTVVSILAGGWGGVSYPGRRCRSF